jgi:uncharacterized protein (DUF1501 family)
MLRCQYACGSADHKLDRRLFLTASAGMLGIGALQSATTNQLLSSQQKRVVMVYLHGGVSQLETWDPKPGTNTGGPFRPIQTKVPGMQISELLPYTSKWVHKLSIVRSLNTKEDDHGKGDYMMETGRAKEQGIEYPHFGAVCAKLLAPEDGNLPGYIHVTPNGSGVFSKTDSAFLGPKYGSVMLGNGQAPPNIARPSSLPEGVDQQREAIRQKLNERFLQTRKNAMTEAYTASYDQATRVVRSSKAFDLNQEDPKELDRYGTHPFGKNCLLARRLLEHGATFVKVTHTNYDTHHENFDFHIEQLGEFDRPFANLVQDLDERGMLDSTLIVVMSEFGRTPNINALYGRDHWSKAWSVAVGGCGIVPGAVIGKTNANGTAVTDREVGAGHLFHTYLQALKLDSKRNFRPNDRPVPIADPKAEAIKELLA